MTLGESASTRWCRFELDGLARFGLVRDDFIVEVEGSPFGSYEVTTRRHPFSEARLLTPAAPVGFYAMGLNFEAHTDWAKSYGIVAKGQAPRSKPHLGYRSPHALVHPGDDITVPWDSPGEIHYESELVAVVGKRAKGLSVGNSLGCVLGFTLGNDLSQRTWQGADRTNWRAKDAEGTKPMGPLIATDLDPMNLEITTRVNEKVVSRYCTADMIFGPAQMLAVLTRYHTVHPGDVLWLGTQGATLPPLQDGDVVEISCPEIGSLRNRVARTPVTPYLPSGIEAWDDEIAAGQT